MATVSPRSATRLLLLIGQRGRSNADTSDDRTVDVGQPTLVTRLLAMKGRHTATEKKTASYLRVLRDDRGEKRRKKPSPVDQVLVARGRIPSAEAGGPCATRRSGWRQRRPRRPPTAIALRAPSERFPGHTSLPSGAALPRTRPVGDDCWGRGGGSGRDPARAMDMRARYAFPGDPPTARRPSKSPCERPSTCLMVYDMCVRPLSLPPTPSLPRPSSLLSSSP